MTYLSEGNAKGLRGAFQWGYRSGTQLARMSGRAIISGLHGLLTGELPLAVIRCFALAVRPCPENPP